VFTARQSAVVEAVRHGKANKVIAYELNMRESTVKVHIRNIMRKLKARNRTEVAFLTNNLFSNDSASSVSERGP
jgi:DNA-binding NarL/FixJ family response regulator